jgi:hypothetical protein
VTRDETTRMAQVCDLGRVCGPLDTLLDHEWEDLQRFAGLVAAEERERNLAAASEACRAFGKAGAVLMAAIRAKVSQ